MKVLPTDTDEVLDQELSSQWLELTGRVRHLSHRLSVNLPESPLAEDLNALIQDATELCDHVERLHSNVGQLLTRLEESEAERNRSETPREDDTNPEVQREVLEIQKETHQRDSVSDVIKALFLWRDDPKERLRNKHQ